MNLLTKLKREPILLGRWIHGTMFNDWKRFSFSSRVLTTDPQQKHHKNSPGAMVRTEN